MGDRGVIAERRKRGKMGRIERKGGGRGGREGGERERKRGGEKGCGGRVG